MKIGPRQIELGFFLVASVELAALLFEFQELNQFTKPLLLLLLSVFFYLSVKADYSLFHKIIQAALFFSWVGDIFLMWDHRGELYFMMGLIAFLIAHITYIFGFNVSVRKAAGSSELLKRPISGAPYIILAGFVYYSLYPNLSALAIPVFIYTVALLLMVLFALNRKERVNGPSFRWVFYGALLFMLSDMLLAFNKFAEPFPHASVAVMVTYILGQYMIVKGCIAHS
jgi:uncharacterized membrane protein YhhN